MNAQYLLAVLVIACLTIARPIVDPTKPLISGGNIGHRDSDWETVPFVGPVHVDDVGKPDASTGVVGNGKGKSMSDSAANLEKVTRPINKKDGAKIIRAQDATSEGFEVNKDGRNGHHSIAVPKSAVWTVAHVKARLSAVNAKGVKVKTREEAQAVMDKAKEQPNMALKDIQKDIVDAQKATSSGAGGSGGSTKKAAKEATKKAREDKQSGGGGSGGAAANKRKQSGGGGGGGDSGSGTKNAVKEATKKAREDKQSGGGGGAANCKRDGSSCSLANRPKTATARHAVTKEKSSRGAKSAHGTTTKPATAHKGSSKPAANHKSTTQRKNIPAANHKSTTRQKNASAAGHKGTTQQKHVPAAGRKSTTQHKNIPAANHKSTTQHKNTPAAGHKSTTQKKHTLAGTSNKVAPAASSKKGSSTHPAKPVAVKMGPSTKPAPAAMKKGSSTKPAPGTAKPKKNHRRDLSWNRPRMVYEAVQESKRALKGESVPDVPN